MKIWIVWLPNVGKSTLFNALTKSYVADAANFPFCTIEPNIGIVNVQDPRLDILAQMSKTEKIVPATIKFVDIAWLVKGASSGEWLGNKFLANIRETDALVQVIRYFQDGDIIHVHGKVDPIYDADIINTELIMADLEQVDRALPSLDKAKNKTRDQDTLLEVYKACKAALESGILIHDIMFDMTPDQLKALKWCNFLTSKPLIYAVNIAESDLASFTSIESDLSSRLGKPVSAVCAKLEFEMLDMNTDDRAMFLDEYGVDPVTGPTLDKLIKLAFDTVWLMYYFTTGVKETRAWSIPLASTAPQAAWAIHTDFEKWFIKAEVVKYTDFVAHGGKSWAKDKWCVKLEGKEYIVQDGDIMEFRFNV